MTPHVLRLGGELHTADHACCCQRGDDVIVDGQYAEVVRGPCCQVVHQEVLAGWRDHPVVKERREGREAQLFSLSEQQQGRRKNKVRCIYNSISGFPSNSLIYTALHLSDVFFFFFFLKHFFMA